MEVVAIYFEGLPMPQVEIPADLFEQAAQANGSVEQFVSSAVREKLARKRRLGRLRELAGEIRAGLEEQGVTEEEVLADFEAQREVPKR